MYEIVSESDTGKEKSMPVKNLINRSKYKDIKRYDHSQMEQFARSLYESGLKDGAEQAVKQMDHNKKKINLDKLKSRLMDLKGIGPVKAEQIVEVIRNDT